MNHRNVLHGTSETKDDDDDDDDDHEQQQRQDDSDAISLVESNNNDPVGDDDNANGPLLYIPPIHPWETIMTIPSTHNVGESLLLSRCGSCAIFSFWWPYYLSGTFEKIGPSKHNDHGQTRTSPTFV
jgi:hypothetical protein